jgi:transcription factor SPN1
MKKVGSSLRVVRKRRMVSLIIDQFVAELEVVSEEDANLNRQSKLANYKLMKLPLLMEFLSK